jgi:hypothetical protein
MSDSPAKISALRTSEVLADEFEAIFGADAEPVRQLRQALGAADDEAEKLHHVRHAAHQLQPAALCLSGGGIRSAAFGLGILQALARADLLTRFHYLSTVSGGGHIGSWLSTWIYWCGGSRPVIAGLRAPGGAESEPLPIRHIRQYSNYLTPQVGPVTAKLCGTAIDFTEWAFRQEFERRTPRIRAFLPSTQAARMGEMSQVGAALALRCQMA